MKNTIQDYNELLLMARDTIDRLRMRASGTNALAENEGFEAPKDKSNFINLKVTEDLRSFKASLKILLNEVESLSETDLNQTTLTNDETTHR